MLEFVSFHEQHNHELASLPKKHMSRSKREVAPAQKAIANDVERPGISITQAIDSLSVQAGGGENLEFMNVDYKNSVHNEWGTALKKGDGHAMMEYFREIQLEDPSFFYSKQLDDDNKS
ncbi:hypothetical protein SO802_027311 [Lithocarpus litseifolius]|uniref:Uncharacterized protein n=1 Tax=Lithocarpus litseifolius TaxID=425828 RepID=A0AAW2C253_9ROSI